jgi:hypothetical protein
VVHDLECFDGALSLFKQPRNARRVNYRDVSGRQQLHVLNTHLDLSFFFLSKNSNSMAFISQFGEYNPGGGKDQVLKYLNESETQVLLAKKSLKTIIDALEG